MLSRVVLLSLVLGGCAQAGLPNVKAATTLPLAVSAPHTGTPRAARVRRVARLAPPFASAEAARRVNASEPASVTASVDVP
jgi:hypothetical protein